MSYLSTWEQIVKRIQGQIVYDLQHTTEDVFTPETVFWGVRPSNQSMGKFPYAFLRMSQDNVTLATRSEESHVLMFELLVGIRSTNDPQDAENDKLEAIGVIYDAIREDNTLGGYADWAIVRSVNARFQESESYIFHDVLVMIEVHVTWGES